MSNKIITKNLMVLSPAKIINYIPKEIRFAKKINLILSNSGFAESPSKWDINYFSYSDAVA